MNPTRDPLPAPFPVGAVIRRIDGPHGDPFVPPGTVCTVIENRPGHRGTGRIVDLGDGDEPFVDQTSDGYSVIEVRGLKRCVLPYAVSAWLLEPSQ